MNIAMTSGEQKLLSSFFDSTHSYIEFGSGGSTLLACDRVAGTIISIDSSREWQAKVSAEVDSKAASKLELLHVDIGPLKNLGYPADESRRDYWGDYHTKVWERIGKPAADTYLIDGRFRNACFIQAIMHARPDSVVLVHDFRNRPHYVPMRAFGREIVHCDNLSAFVRRPDFNVEEARAVVQKHYYDCH